MWWSRTLLVCSVLALGPVGCGFQPLYGRTQGPSPVAAELANIWVLGIEDRLGQQMRNALISRITPSGEPGSPRYVLDVKLMEQVEGLAQSQTGHATLARLAINATYVLRDATSQGDTPGGRNVASGTSRSVVSFRMLGPRYGSVATERDAEERAVSELAEDIRGQLASRFSLGLAGARREQ